jgi:hypothetical protein
MGPVEVAVGSPRGGVEKAVALLHPKMLLRTACGDDGSGEPVHSHR